MNIRLLAAADAAAFQALRLEALLDTPGSFASSHAEEKDATPEQVVQRLAPSSGGGGVLGAFDGAALLGFVGLARETRAKFAHKAHIWGMYVRPELRGHGLARELMRAALELAHGMPGLAKVMLVADSTNVAAIALYESLGFVVFGREQDAMRLDGRRHDDLHMALRIAAA